jgi:PKD repeat protein
MKINYTKVFIMFCFFFSLITNGQTLTPLPANQATQNGTQQRTQGIPEFCGTDSLHDEKMKSDPDYKKRHEEMLESIGTAASSQRRLPNGVLQVPVVVHVMHKGETIGTGTNISDEEVKLGLKYLNNYWRSISDTYGDGDGVDMKIEFVLAIQDPNGNMTNGIDRVDLSTDDAYVNNGVNRRENSGISDTELKAYSVWDPYRYYNVWIIDEIDNTNCFTGTSYIAGYAYYASAHGQSVDGSVVLICTYLEEGSNTWAHEMGHALNLPHTFDGDDPDNGICGDDGIPDTPEHIRTSGITPSIYWDCGTTTSNNCDLAFNQVINPETGYTRSSGTHQDHMFNHMDYSGCSSEFTGGQRNVATNALTAGRGSRKSYFEGSALVPVAAAVVDFNSPSIICLGDVTTFTDLSANTPNSFTNNGYDNISFAWTFDNGADTAITSTDQNPSIIFSNSGTYDVTLEITNLQGTSSLTKQNSFIITSSSLPTYCEVTSLNSLGNYGTGVTRVSFNNLSNITSTSNVSPIVRDFRCSKNTQINVDISYDLTVDYNAINDYSQRATVWIDWDNNGTFDSDEKVLDDNVDSGNAGSYSATVSVTPPTDVVTGIPLTMRVISVTRDSGNSCGEGLIKRADEYGVLVNATLNTKTVNTSQLKLFPNPVQDELTLTLQNNAPLSAYEIYDISGKKVMTSTLNPSNRIQVSELSKGMYFMKIKAGNLEMIGKFIKK